VARAGRTTGRAWSGRSAAAPAWVIAVCLVRTARHGDSSAWRQRHRGRSGDAADTQCEQQHHRAYDPELHETTHVTPVT